MHQRGEDKARQLSHSAKKDEENAAHGLEKPYRMQKFVHGVRCRRCNRLGYAGCQVR